ncbi:hypothetical protein ANO11243_079800 [Dothideomycetidae sp. 11243]|nr:hypothetical protein ANO11243_079800 [fungal sp. No.11243]
MRLEVLLFATLSSATFQKTVLGVGAVIGIDRIPPPKSLAATMRPTTLLLTLLAFFTTTLAAPVQQGQTGGTLRPKLTLDISSRTNTEAVHILPDTVSHPDTHPAPNPNKKTVSWKPELVESSPVTDPRSELPSSKSASAPVKSILKPQ